MLDVYGNKRYYTWLSKLIRIILKTLKMEIRIKNANLNIKI